MVRVWCVQGRRRSPNPWRQVNPTLVAAAHTTIRVRPHCSSVQRACGSPIATCIYMHITTRMHDRRKREKALIAAPQTKANEQRAWSLHQMLINDDAPSLFTACQYYVVEARVHSTIILTTNTARPFTFQPLQGGYGRTCSPREPTPGPARRGAEGLVDVG